MDIRVIEFLASRMCHDLISPIGAVHNGVEFLQDMGADAMDDALGLIAHSSGQASAKLQIFRLVYGAGAKTSALEISDIHEAMEAFIKGDEKVVQSWQAKDDLIDGTPTSGFCKMLLAGLLIAYESLPKGGEIKVERGETGEVFIHASGDDAQPRAGTQRGLEGDLDLDEMDPRLVHSYVTWIMGQAYGYKISLKEVSPGSVSLSLTAQE